MANRTYHWIKDDEPHFLARSHKARHYGKQKFKYFMLTSYGEQDVQGLRVHLQCVLTLHS